MKASVMRAARDRRATRPTLRRNLKAMEKALVKDLLTSRVVRKRQRMNMRTFTRRREILDIRAMARAVMGAQSFPVNLNLSKERAKALLPLVFSDPEKYALVSDHSYRKRTCRLYEKSALKKRAVQEVKPTKEEIQEKKPDCVIC
jgi:hypothetical protein